MLDALELVSSSGIPGDSDPTIFDVGTGAFLEFFDREVLVDLVTQGGSTCRFFEGDYGAGKTHLLNLIRERALGRGMAAVQIELSEDLGMDDWFPVTKTVLQNLHVRVDGVEVRGLPSILDALRTSGWGAAASLHGMSLPHVGFRNAMMYAVTEEAPPMDLWRYLLGERIPATRLHQQGLDGIKDPLSRKNSELVLATVTAGLHRFGLAGTSLLFDETEHTLVSRRDTPSKKLRVAANLMRRLIDGCTTERLVGAAVVFAVLPGFVETCTRQYPALGQRLEVGRTDDVAPAWRWPVLPLDSVTTADPFDFLDGAAARFVQIVEHCGGDIGDLMDDLVTAGGEALSAQAGSGYRRPLMKRLATLSLQRIEEVA